MSAPSDPLAVTGDEKDVRLTLARLEAKIDVVIAQHETKINGHEADLLDHEERLRVLERKPTVSPRALWTTVSSGVAVMAVIGPLIARFYA